MVGFFKSQKQKTSLLISVEDCHRHRKNLLLAIETEVDDRLTVLIATFKCPPWITAPLNRPVAGITGLITNYNVSASLSLATDAREGCGLRGSRR